MNILVLGGNGYLGNVLCPKLLAAGHNVTSLDLHWFGDHLPESVCKVQGDICDRGLMCKEINAHDIVIHLAGMIGPIFSATFPYETYQINYMSSRYIAELCKSKRLIYISSCSVYGFDEEKILDEEISDLFPVSLYGITKAKSERLFYETVPGATILRTGTLYGASPRMRYDLIANLFVAKALNQETLTVYGGDQWRPMVCVSDLADAILWSVDHKVRGVFNVLYNNYTVKLIAELVSAKFGVKVEVDHTKHDLRSVIAKADKLRQGGFVPTKSVIDAAEDIKNLESWSDYGNKSLYWNVGCIEKLKLEGYGHNTHVVQ